MSEEESPFCQWKWALKKEKLDESKFMKEMIRKS